MDLFQEWISSLDSTFENVPSNHSISQSHTSWQWLDPNVSGKSGTNGPNGKWEMGSEEGYLRHDFLSLVKISCFPLKKKLKKGTKKKSESKINPFELSFVLSYFFSCEGSHGGAALSGVPIRI
jgi:hypothetical protein